MSNTSTPNQFSWSELMTTEPQAASEFYGSLFGWQFETMTISASDDDNAGESYLIASNNGEQIAGIMQKPAEVPSPVWGQYVTVTDIEATAQKITDLQGTVLTPPTQIPGIGRFIVFIDPQGAPLSAIQYDQPAA